MIEDIEIMICTECVKEIRLKLLGEKYGNNGICTCCGKSGHIVDTNSNEFIQMIKALIRYHYSEWDYNPHWGGDDYGTFFYNDDNVFLNKLNFINQDIYDELVNRIECYEVYEDYEKGISLFAGYYEGEQNMLLRSIKTDLDSSITKIGNQLMEENYFNFENEISNILSAYTCDCQLTLKKGEEFFRARVGYEDKKRSTVEFFEGEDIYIPYANSKIGAPSPYLAGNGRINRLGVSFLYCSTDKYTAVSEIRPHPGDIVSIGKFVSNKDLLIFDLTEKSFLNFYDSDKKLDAFKKLNTITELMQKTIPPSERLNYNITQLIADCIRQLNFDGILFPSSVGNGSNLVVFNPRTMDYTYDEAEVIEVKEVKYEYINRKWKKDINEIE